MGTLTGKVAIVTGCGRPLGMDPGEYGDPHLAFCSPSDVHEDNLRGHLFHPVG